MVATNLLGKTHQGKPTKKSATKVFPLQSTVRCWAGPTEGKETQSSSGCPGASGSDPDPFEDVSNQGLGISWTSAFWQVAYFSPLFWQDVWPSTAFWPASHGLVDHGGPCNAASELTVGAVLCNATTSESAALVTAAPSFIPHWIVFVGAKHPRHPSIKTIATSNAGTWKWKQPWNLADLKGWNMSSNMWQVTCVCLALACFGCFATWEWVTFQMLAHPMLTWKIFQWRPSCSVCLLRPIHSWNFVIAALRHCGCSGPQTYLEGVYYEVLQPIAAASCSAPRRSAMWAGFDTCKACFDG